ncbi:DUF2635 domain-containing protein [Chromobacterium violaceum]|uniref:DUF2635 domain-containing protein n=1 Tax=Chromobacterium violaceum TaxID=536 RepID=A0A202B2A9_CHRVL|nr:DUF2635 domain-containing protein [Chromobacterium violaceum]OVE45589.1 hypothetical protein CBW21_22380 [Chromobacterium violaceum]
MYVKPTEGFAIRDPDLLDLLPAAGREVPDTDYWLRRLRDGDVVQSAAEAAPDTAGSTKKGGDK